MTAIALSANGNGPGTICITGPCETSAGVSWTFHSERATLAVLRIGFEPAGPAADTRLGGASATHSRDKRPARPRMLWMGRCRTAFIGYLRVSIDMLRFTGPDLTDREVIPGSEGSAEPGINRAAAESIGVR